MARFDRNQWHHYSEITNIKATEEAEADRKRRRLFNTQNFFGMKNEQEMLNLFQVEELEKRYEMGWIRVSTQGSPTGTNVGGSDHGTVGPMHTNQQ